MRTDKLNLFVLSVCFLYCRGSFVEATFVTIVFAWLEVPYLKLVIGQNLR